MDPLVGGLWLAAIWVWLTGSRGIRARANLWPGVIVLIVYGLLTGTEILKIAVEEHFVTPQLKETIFGSIGHWILKAGSFQRTPPADCGVRMVG